MYKLTNCAIWVFKPFLKIIKKFNTSEALLFRACLSLLFFNTAQTSFTQSIFTSTVNVTGGFKVVPRSIPEFAGHQFEWSVGESSIITTNLSSNLMVNHGVLQGFLLNTPQTPNLLSWFPDEIKIYPIPVVNEFRVELLTDKKGVATFVLFDAKGSLLYQRSKSYYGTGHSEQFTIGHLPPGVYLLRAIIRAFPDAGGNLLKEGAFKIIKN